MSNSLKDALIKAGVIKQDSLDREKEKERRDKIEKKGPLQHGVHAHHIRTDCAQCKKNSPDVEFYEHTNRSIEAKWLCIRCADKAWIKDECRQTHQSSQAMAGKFRREFGATKRFPPPGSAPEKSPMVKASPPSKSQPTSNAQSPTQGQSQPNTGTAVPQSQGNSTSAVQSRPAKIPHPRAIPVPGQKPFHKGGPTTNNRGKK